MKECPGKTDRTGRTHMNPEMQRIAIAEACGWKAVEFYADGGPRIYENNGHIKGPDTLPDYPNDLNAMREAEKSLDYQTLLDYFRCLERIVDAANGGDVIAFAVGRANAAQKAEAFLRTKGLWK